MAKFKVELKRVDTYTWEGEVELAAKTREEAIAEIEGELSDQGWAGIVRNDDDGEYDSCDSFLVAIDDVAVPTPPVELTITVQGGVVTDVEASVDNFVYTLNDLDMPDEEEEDEPE